MALASYGFPGSTTDPNLLVNTTILVDSRLTNSTLYSILNNYTTRSNVQSGLAGAGQGQRVGVVGGPVAWEAAWRWITRPCGSGSGGAARLRGVRVWRHAADCQPEA